MYEAMPIIIESAIIQPGNDIHLLNDAISLRYGRPVPHPNGRSEVRDEGRIDFLKRQMVPSERPFASHKVTKILGIETTHHGRIAICPSLTKGTDQRLVAFGISFDTHRRSPIGRASGRERVCLYG